MTNPLIHELIEFATVQEKKTDEKNKVKSRRVGVQTAKWKFHYEIINCTPEKELKPYWIVYEWSLTIKCLCVFFVRHRLITPFKVALKLTSIPPKHASFFILIRSGILFVLQSSPIVYSSKKWLLIHLYSIAMFWWHPWAWLLTLFSKLLNKVSREDHEWACQYPMNRNQVGSLQIQWLKKSHKQLNLYLYSVWYQIYGLKFLSNEMKICLNISVFRDWHCYIDRVQSQASGKRTQRSRSLP